MASTQKQTKKERKPRKDCQYSRAEMAILRPFKDQYQAQLTREKQIEFVQTHILTEIFNYWTDFKTIPMTEEEVLKRTTVGIYYTNEMFIKYGHYQELCKWLSNNWRPIHPIVGNSGRAKPKTAGHKTVLDALWKTRQHDVEEEIHAVLKVKGLEADRLNIFTHRTAVSKAMVDGMDSEELDALVEEREAMRQAERPVAEKAAYV